MIIIITSSSLIPSWQSSPVYVPQSSSGPTFATSKVLESMNLTLNDIGDYPLYLYVCLSIYFTKIYHPSSITHHLSLSITHHLSLSIIIYHHLSLINSHNLIQYDIHHRLSLSPSSSSSSSSPILIIIIIYPHHLSSSSVIINITYHHHHYLSSSSSPIIIRCNRVPWGLRRTSTGEHDCHGMYVLYEQQTRFSHSYDLIGWDVRRDRAGAYWSIYDLSSICSLRPIHPSIWCMHI